ncbi:MAG: ribonuclease HII [Oscillospiraceae bacterium]|nr:ribonuclease HII [Clostridiales bacterium]MDY2961674.1 ribonuclease HII [Oscillospiraceae bacterium]
MNTTDLWEMENELLDRGIAPLCGVDEAGRGPLAGPVCAAAVMLPRNLVIPGLNDSKKLSPKKRDALYDAILAQAVSYGIAFATVEEIEKWNILGATFLAMNRAIEQLSEPPALALIDGNRNSGIHGNSQCVVGGDGKCAEIAAASILAKVTRDRYMLQMAEQYPQYGFAQHKGYGTAAHYAALREYGPCPIHRPSFLKKMH